MQIRRATRHDREAVLSLLDELGEEVNGFRGYDQHNAEASKVGGAMFEEVVSRRDTMIFVAEAEGRLAGLVTLYIIPSIRHGRYRGHIEDVVVAGPMRGKGVGTALFTAVKEYCRAHGISVIKLDSANELHGAHAFYAKQGGVFTEHMFRFDIP